MIVRLSVVSSRIEFSDRLLKVWLSRLLISSWCLIWVRLVVVVMCMFFFGFIVGLSRFFRWVCVSGLLDLLSRCMVERCSVGLGLLSCRLVRVRLRVFFMLVLFFICRCVLSSGCCVVLVVFCNCCVVVSCSGILLVINWWLVRVVLSRLCR